MKFGMLLRYSGVLLVSAVMGVSAGEASQVAQYKQDVAAIMPGFASFGPATGTKVALRDHAGKTIGTLLLAPSGKYERVEGYNGTINVGVVVDGKQKITGVAVGDQEETPRFFQRVRKAGLLKRWNGLSVKDAAAHKVEAVSRATYSSEAIISEVKAVLKAAN